MIFHFKLMEYIEGGVGLIGEGEKLVVQLPPSNFAFIKVYF
jgi:hypothetical protein